MRSLNLFFALLLTMVFSPYSLKASEAFDVSDEINFDTNCAFVAVWDPSGIKISGWALSLTPFKQIETLHVKIKDKEFYIPFSQEKPEFSFIIPVSQEDRLNLKNSLIAITPLIQNKKSYSFYYIFDTYLPFPPQKELDSVGGEVIATASNILNVLTRCGLKKTDKVLEVGCGLGRIAYALAYYLTPETTCEGFDIVSSLIDLANRCITPYFKNFHYQHANIYNGMYNPQGPILASNFTFPYPDESFDFVFLTSVFTHMLPEDVKHYLQEIRRVLRPGGKCMATAFLLNDRSRALMTLPTSCANFRYSYGEYTTFDTNVLEGAVAYDQNLFLQWIHSAGFKTRHVFPGIWCNTADSMNCVTYQDVILFIK